MLKSAQVYVDLFILDKLFKNMSNSLIKMLNVSTISFGGRYTFTITYFFGYGVFL